MRAPLLGDLSCGYVVHVDALGGHLHPRMIQARQLAALEAALPDSGNHRVALGHLLLDGEGGASPALEDLRHRAFEILAGRTLPGHQAAIDEVLAKQLVYDVEAPPDELLQEAANEGLVLFRRGHSRFLLLANVRPSYGSATSHDASRGGLAHRSKKRYSP